MRTREELRDFAARGRLAQRVVNKLLKDASADRLVRALERIADALERLAREKR
jgi:hypothetical protein